MKIFVITTPDSIGTSLITRFESEGLTVVHSLYNWKNEKGRAMFSLFEGRVKPSFSVPTDYLALEGSDVVVVDLEADNALVAEFMALAVHFGKRIIGVFGTTPQPSKFSGWCEVIVHTSRVMRHLEDKRKFTFDNLVLLMSAIAEDQDMTAAKAFLGSYPKAAWAFMTTGTPLEFSLLHREENDGLQEALLSIFNEPSVQAIVTTFEIV